MGKKQNKTQNIFNPFENGHKVPKNEYEEAIPKIRLNLINMQYDLKDCDFPVLILLAGNNRKAVNELLDILHEWMDARYLDTNVFFTHKPEELVHPSYWRYWRAMPHSGRIGVFLGAWTIRALAERVLEKGTGKTFERRIEHIKALERCLVDNDTELIKIWLHVPEDTIQKSLEDAKKDPDKEPYIRQRDWEIYKKYDNKITYASDLIAQTSTATAPWNIIESSNKRYRNLSAASHILEIVSKRIAESQQKKTHKTKKEKITTKVLGPLNTVNLKSTIDYDDYHERLERLQAKLSRSVLKARDKFSTVLVFEGWDAAGKGGVIRRITRSMFAEDYRVIPIAAPTDEEKRYHYLWRFWRHVPRDGEVRIFDRSWYGRVLVERVEGFATREHWQNAYGEINDFEKQLTEHGIVICKFWLHIDPDEQLRRFKEREKTGYKKYKITEEDYRNREKWDDYTLAVNDMVEKTSQDYAPWHLVPANDKRFARISVLETVVDAMKKRLKEY